MDNNSGSQGIYEWWDSVSESYWQHQVNRIELKLWLDVNIFTTERTLNSGISSWYFWYRRGLEHLVDVMCLTTWLHRDQPMRARLYCVYYDVNETPVCHVCGIPVAFKTFNRGYQKYCSDMCVQSSDERRHLMGSAIKLSAPLAVNKRKASNLLKYGVESTSGLMHVREKTQQTNLAKYGYTSNLGCPDVREAIYVGHVEKYGCRYPTQSDIVKQQIRDTCLEKYGVDNYFKTEHVKSLTIARFKDHYPALRDAGALSVLHNQKSIAEMSEELGVTYTAVRSALLRNNIPIIRYPYRRGNTIGEREIAEFVASLGVEVRQHDRTALYPKEVDVYVPEHKLAIEYNGLFWHSEMCEWVFGAHKDFRTMHLTKHNLCEKSHIRLLQFWSHEWSEKQDICKSIIAAILGRSDKIFARKCKVSEVGYQEYNEFLNQNHLQGPAQAKYRYALLYNGRIVAVMGFMKSRYSKYHDFELVRYATLLNTRVLGGFSKLLSVFRARFPSTTIVTYSDVRLFTGDVYQKSGFIKQRRTKPGYAYYSHLDGTDIVESRIKYQKHKLSKVFADFDDSLTEKENMNLHHYAQVWDCGQDVWVLE